MNPAMLVVQALAAGAAAGVSGAASAAVTDTYQTLKEALAARLAGSPQTLERIGTLHHRPGAPTEYLVHDLVAAEAIDAEVVRYARQLLALVDDAGSGTAAGRFDLREARGVQLGDGNTQHNTFG